MKRTICMTMALLLLVTALTACGRAGKQTAAKLLARIRNRKPFHLKRNLSRPNRLLNGMRHRKLLHFQK